MSTTTASLLLWALVRGLVASTAAAVPKNAAQTIAYSPETHSILFYDFPVVAGQEYLVSTFDLKPVTTTTLTPSATTAPDTVIYVLNKGALTVVASDDDGNTDPSQSTASSLQFTATTSFAARVVVTAFTGGSNDVDLSFGTTDILVWNVTTGTALHALNDVEFGGWSLGSRTFRQGDRVFVGVAPDSQAHDVFRNRAVLFSNSALTCSSNCGTYQELDTMVDGLSRLKVPTTISLGRIYVGSGVGGERVSARLLHSRIGAGWGAAACPTTSGFADCDGDGLSRELEAATHATDRSLAINTCESVTGPSTFCQGDGVRHFNSRGADWHPRDSDNDGLSDLHEVFGILRTCASAPVAPYFFPGACLDATLEPQAGATSYWLALSALDPDPTDVDVFVHAVPQLTPTGNNAWPAALNPVPLRPPPYSPTTVNGNHTDFMNYIYEQEGLECEENFGTAGCGVLPYYHINVHLLWASPIDALLHTAQTSDWPTYDYFNAAIASNWFTRRFTGVFRYAQFLSEPGVGFSSGRTLTGYGNVAPNVIAMDRAAAVTAHELGHSLGLGHGGNDDDNFKAPYPSLMNYGFGVLPRKGTTGDIWPEDFGTVCACTGATPPVSCLDAACNQGGRCTGARNSPTLNCPVGQCINMAGVCARGGNCATYACAVDVSREAARFSRGGNPTFDEGNMPAEAGMATRRAATQLHAYGGVSGDPYEPFAASCLPAGICNTDWNWDFDRNDPAGNTVASSLNGNSSPGGANQATDAGIDDNNDWLSMFDAASDNIRVVDSAGAAVSSNLTKRRFRVFQSDLNSTTTVDDVSAWNHTVTRTGVTLGAPSVPANLPAPGFSPPAPPYGTGVGFNGAGSLSIPASAASATLGQTLLPGFSPEGWRFDVFVEFDNIAPTNSGHQIAVSSLFDIYAHIYNGSFTLVAVFKNGVNGNRTLRTTGPAGGFVANAWYWITATWSSIDGKATLYVVPYNAPVAPGPAVGGWRFTSPDPLVPAGVCVSEDYSINSSANIAPGVVTFGQDPTSTNWALSGTIDEPKVFN